MTAKEQAIKEAYGEHWERLKDFINEDGVFIGDTDLISDELFNNWSFIASAKDINSERKIAGSRPKSLQGIETNRGWIKIESEDDLPKENIRCYFIFQGEILDGKFLGKTFSWNFGFSGGKNITHYQPITKPQPPIY